MGKLVKLEAQQAGSSETLPFMKKMSDKLNVLTGKLKLVCRQKAQQV